jgi:hypothetical protein
VARRSEGILLSLVCWSLRRFVGAGRAPSPFFSRSERKRNTTSSSKITPTDTIQIDEVRHWLNVARRVGAGRPLFEGAVWPVLVVTLDVRRKDFLELGRLSPYASLMTPGAFER